MGFSKYIIPALSVAATAYGSSSCSAATATVQNGGDASAIGGCPTFTGSVAIVTGAAGASSLDFGQVKAITGTVTYEGDSEVQGLVMGSLQTLGGLTLTNLSQLSTLDLHSINQIGDLSLSSLSLLSTLNLGSNLTKVGAVNIDNTLLADISGISGATQVTGVSIINNNYLTNVSFGVNEIGIVEIGPNNKEQTMDVSFPNLVTAQSLTFRNATSLATPKLANVSNTLGLYGNTMESYNATALLSAGALVINDNSALTQLSFPKLQQINSQNNGTLQVANNTKLTGINAFPALTTVIGNVDFSGNIDNITLPKLTSITGALFVDTSSSDFDCDAINNLSSSQVVRGATNCTSNDATPSGTSGGSGGSGTGSSGSSASSSSAAMVMDVPAFVTGASVFGSFLAFLMM